MQSRASIGKYIENYIFEVIGDLLRYYVSEVGLLLL